MLRDVLYRATEGLLMADEAIDTNKETKPEELAAASKALQSAARELLCLASADILCKKTVCGQEMMLYAHILDMAAALQEFQYLEEQTQKTHYARRLKDSVWNILNEKRSSCWLALRHWWLEEVKTKARATGSKEIL